MLPFFKHVYLDQNATTRVSTAVQKKMRSVLRTCYGNPSALYTFAHKSIRVLEKARSIIAGTINAGEHELYFSGSATEANNWALKSLSEYFYPAKKKILALPIEHASVAETLAWLQSKGIVVEYMPVDHVGRLVFDQIEAIMDTDTFLVCCMLANNETGVLQDIKKLATVAHQRGILVMSDCVQALGKIPVDVRDLDIDYATFSAHKIHGPKGAGAFFVKEGSPVSPFVHGGHQEHGLRAGTEAVHNIAGFAEACKAVPKLLLRAEKTRTLKNDFIRGLKTIMPDVFINSPPDHTLPNTISATFPGIDNMFIMAVFDYYGIAVSAGSACNTQQNEPSHVLKAIGTSDAQARSTIRFSLSSETRKSDIKYVLKVLHKLCTEPAPDIAVLSPDAIDEKLLFDESTFVVDVRYWYDRKVLKSLPGSRETSFFALGRTLRLIPKNKNVLLVCQTGKASPMIAYHLKKKGYPRVSYILTGLAGWKAARPDLYQQCAGQNVTKL